MIDKIKLSIFEKLNTKYLNSLEEPSYDDHEDAFIYNTLLKDASTDITPEEWLHFSKADTEDEPAFDDISGLKKLAIHIPDGTKKKHTRKKLKDPECESHSIIGSCMTLGFDNYQHPKLADIYSLKDLFKCVEHLVQEKNHSLQDFKILTLRRHLHLLLKVPIRKQSIQFHVIYWKGLIIFAYDWEPEAQYKKQNPPNGIERLLQYSGMNFENIVCGDDSADYKSRYYSVVNHTVNGVPLLYCAEIDCAIKSEPGLCNYVELKTHSKSADDKIKTVNKLNKKLLEAYCQNKLVGCQHLVMGYRTLDFKLASIKTFKIGEVANIVNNDPIFLKHGCAINTKGIFRWYQLVIQWLVFQEKNLKNQDEATVYRLSFDREDELMDSYLSLTKVDKEESAMIFNSTVPEWFQTFVISQK
ncbi:uncharacterized protein SPAPADRAFT_148716 [Spathaspora passalidarum NRRL Y-27907]|uniref:Decapping nuclease n=1 Tax=Spathaspora passalidarum (strain NRRL Y-27907 / 11-Y1) TaxID=619300 RepID=G3AHM8_SPAPN|nr:uncharacterized protein SPAPADRAFT_148716 [Spathaspora passalidarum NRRL Y-27907]EGW34192.1 hypothetical protein SPAPADRAFT_148716 [Spathaspora passalidarum NRRL Y-27907]